MISEPLVEYLESAEDGHTQWARAHADKTATCLENVGIAPGSAIFELYTRFGWSATTRTSRYELLDPDDIAETTKYAHEELEVSGHFVALTSIEGEGIVLLDRHSGAVFDVQFGQFEDLENGSLRPIAHSQEEFLDWYFSDSDWGEW